MTVNYHVKKSYNIGPWWQSYITLAIYRRILTLVNVGTAVNYRSILQHWPQLGLYYKMFYDPNLLSLGSPLKVMKVMKVKNKGQGAELPSLMS